ncbi:MAG: hypothetical protein QOC60_1786, partial [Frankiaceae bacterium]|nr:hypothetical protein [Frankiaceae bacterium]
VRQPIDVMGRMMIELLMQKMAGTTPVENVVLDTELILRDST